MVLSPALVLHSALIAEGNASLSVLHQLQVNNLWGRNAHDPMFHDCDATLTMQRNV
jgi:hypothetical protein